MRRNHWTVENQHIQDNIPYSELWSPRSRANRFMRWVVRMKETNEIFVVDGREGEFGEEPVIAGPLGTIEDGQIAVEMLMAMEGESLCEE